MPCYEDWEYEYEDNGNYGNGEYEYEHDSYSDGYEPDHSEPTYYDSDPTPSEPDYHNHGHDDHGFVHEVPEYEIAGEEHEHGELHRDEGPYESEEARYESERTVCDEHEELVYDDDELRELEELERMANEEGHEPQTLEYHNNALGTNGYGHHDDDDDVHARSTSTYVPTPTHFPPTPVPISLEHDSLHSNQRGHVTALKSCESTPNTAYNDDDRRRVNRAEPDADERLELEELERMYAKWGHKPPELAALHSVYGGTGDSTTHTPCHSQTPEPDADERLELEELERMYAEWGHEAPDPTALHSAHGGTIDSTNTRPSSPTPVPCLHDTSRSTQPDYVTAYPTYSYLDTLRRDYNNEVPSAIVYMQGLWDFTEDCRYEHEEWKADQQAEIRENHNIAYPKRDYLARPRSWDAPNGPGNTIPRIIEGSRPLRPGLKRRRYRNSRATHSRATYYRSSQPQPPRELEESDVAPAAPPDPTILRVGRHGNNDTSKPPHHTNPNTTPNTISRSRPPPWPNKHRGRDRNQHQHNGTYTPARYTMGQRPPPRPNIPTILSPILPITNSRPPPWPNICHYRHNGHSPATSTPPARPPPWPIIPCRIHSTPQNRRNAKQRAKAKSRIISNKVSI